MRSQGLRSDLVCASSIAPHAACRCRKRASAFSHGSAPRCANSPSDLLKHECIRRRMPGGTLYRWEFEKRGEEMALDVPGRLTLDNDSLMVEAALEGLGLAFASDFWVAKHLTDGTLQAVLEDW